MGSSKSTVLKPKFIIDESGRKSGVLLSIRDYNRLAAAWEEVADSRDFTQAKDTAKDFISPGELRQRLLKKR